MVKMVGLTSVHPWLDTRIFLKQCQIVAQAGHLVVLIVADAKGDEKKDGVQIRDAGSSKGRLHHILNAPDRVFAEACNLDADIYHLHDPELMPIGLKLKRMGKRVVFDSHEDVPKQVLGKPYFNKGLLWMLSKCLAVYESWACAKFDGILAATPFIRDKFLKINPQKLGINKFSLLHELENASPWAEK